MESEADVGVEREGAVKEADGVAGSDKIKSPAVESVIKGTSHELGFNFDQLP